MPAGKMPANPNPKHELLKRRGHPYMPPVRPGTVTTAYYVLVDVQNRMCNILDIISLSKVEQRNAI